MSIRTITLALAAAAAFAAPVAAVAAESGTTTTGVRYKDLDLTTEAGKKELEDRLDKAAKEVCGLDDATTGSRVRSREARDCYRDARAKLGEHFARLVNDASFGG